MNQPVVIGVDVGGTFTDVVAVDRSGSLVITKVASDPEAPENAVVAGIRALATQMGVDLVGLLSEATIIHGSTLAINTLLTRTGARTGLICTEGFRDITEIRTGYRHERFDLRAPPPIPLVPRHLRLEVRERIDENGKVLRTLEEADIIDACRVFESEGVEAIAVCFLWSFMNASHENRVRDTCEKLLPATYITISSDVLPEIREYDRWSTTVLNAYLGPKFGGYIGRLEDGLREAGLRGRIQYLQSNGGVANRDEIVRVPSRTLLSGPATGPVAARYIASREGWDNVICIDMGGTSFDTSAVTRGEIRQSRPVDIDSLRVGFPMVDVHSIGGGGGSVAHLDSGILRVGPQSAGSHPGPAAYGLGGSDPTVTDADLLLGLYQEGSIAGGVSLATSPARATVGRLADEMQMPAAEAAEGIWRVLTDQLAEAVRGVTIAEGRDPRDYVMVAGGGAGPAHCCAIADRLGITDVFVPRAAPALCAFGAILTDEIHDLRRSYPMRLGDGAAYGELDDALAEIQSEVLRRAGAGPGDATPPRSGRAQDSGDAHPEGDEPVELRSGIELRYQGQLWEILLWLHGDEIDAATADETVNRFHDRHNELYAYSEPDTPCEAVSLAVRATVRREVRLADRPPRDEGREWRPVGSRTIAGLWTGGASQSACSDGNGISAAIYDGADAVAGLPIDGPALIYESMCVIVVDPGWRAELTATDTYHLSCGT